MKKIIFALIICCWFLSGFSQPLKLDPTNSHYFSYKNKPIILVTSAMHYGAVFNLDINQELYLKNLEKYGFNLHREFILPCYAWKNGGEWENVQSPISPRPGKLLSPYLRSDEPGCIDSLNKFDLDKWNKKYFDSLKDFCKKAEKKGIIIEITLFTVQYRDQNWATNPLNTNNNINGTGNCKFNEYTFVRDEKLFEKQKQLAAKVVTELNEFDNVYFEILNEPYWSKGIPEIDTTIKAQHFLPEVIDWEKAITDIIVKTESILPKKHLIAQNFANTYYKIDTFCHPSISVLNFHYAFPPKTIADNYQLNKPVCFDETAVGCDAPDRRVEGWAFIMAGGAVYNNLDWSYAIDDQTCRGRNPKGPRRSGLEVQQQLSVLKRFIESVDFINSKPIDSTKVEGLHEKVKFWGLENPDSECIIYFLKRGNCKVTNADIKISKGTYLLEWIDPIDLSIKNRRKITNRGDLLSVDFPYFSDDLILRLKKQ